MRIFNTNGPVTADKHYCIPPLDRLDLDEMLDLIGQEKYFVLHAPRQSGKTSSLLALRDFLNSTGTYRCVYATFECGQAAREDKERAVRAILDELANRALLALDDGFLDSAWPGILAKSGPDRALQVSLMRWAAADPKPLVVLIDEIDALVGNSLVTVLRQIRSGHDLRPEAFPQSIMLCGSSDVRDYRMESGGSPFNIKAKSLRFRDLSRDEVATLLGQHTAETGQEFLPEAVETIWMRTRGQPWLVNALAFDACFENESGRDRSRPIASSDFEAAQERLILRRETHLDHLAAKLKQEPVRRVIEALLTGGDPLDWSERDIEYVRGLGLIAANDPVRIANPIYAELVPSELTSIAQRGLKQEREWYVGSDGSLDLPKLLAAFQAFFRENSESWVERLDYKEAGPQLLLQAFLQRIVNGGGRVEREYGLGRGRTDLLVNWSQGETSRKYVIECKVRRKSLEGTIGAGLEQTTDYMDRCAAEAGHLVIFDRSEKRNWDEKVFRRRLRSSIGREIDVWGM